MPEYLYPGVYVEEIDGQPHPIPGVPTSLDAAALTSIAAHFRRTLAAYAPGWTDVNDSDPGVTLLELFAFLTENLLYRAGEIPERGRSAALRTMATLGTLAAFPLSGCNGLTRPRYFEGKMLDAATLTAEQEYHREKRRLHNRALFGSGVVSGLGVSIEPGGERVLVEPGHAIDPTGEEIGLPRAVSLAVPATSGGVFVTLRYWERPCGPTLAADGATAASKIEEACVVALKPAAVDPVVPLARVIRLQGAWRVDTAFEPPRIRRS
jgi:hypothetical protein